MHYYLMGLDQDSSILDDAFVCRNHRQNLIVTHITSIVCMKLMCDLYSLAVFLSLGDHRLRMVATCRSYCEQNVVVLPFPPDPADIAFADQMKQYLTLNYRRERSAHRTDRKSKSMTSIKGLRLRLKFYFDVRNSGFTRVSPEDWGKLFHSCPGKSCCPRGRTNTVMKMTWAIVNVDLAGKPELLELAKWSKLGPVLDWGMLCLLGGFFVVYSPNHQRNSPPRLRMQPTRLLQPIQAPCQRMSGTRWQVDTLHVKPNF